MGKMKLLDLNPRFVDTTNRVGIAIIFDCPHCKKTLIEIPLSNPLDGKPASDWPKTWKRIGDDFSNLTLEPVIDYEGHAHFSVKNGEIINAST